MPKKLFLTFFRLIFPLAAWLIGILALARLDYFANFTAVDNLIGSLPLTLVLVGAGSVTIICWSRRVWQSRSPLILLFTITLLSVILFPIAVRGNWWLNLRPSGGETKPDLTVYAPFSPNSKGAKLDAPSTLTLTDDLPSLDGATALYPVYAAFAEAVYDPAAFTSDQVRCTNTSGSYTSLIKGERDLIFVATPSAQQLETAQAAGADLHFAPIGREAFVFLVGKNNPLDNLSTQQLYNIYSGKTAYWRTLGWPQGGKIIAFQRPEGSGSQTGLQNLMGKLPIQAPQPLPDASLLGTNSLMQQVSVWWRGVQPALGYSYRYFATTMYANPEAKMLQIDGIEPSLANIQNGTYPFTGDFYAVTRGEPTGSAKLLLDWILSPQGQELIAKTGYTPITP